ncbi:hypothetical protein [Kitasatospora sp. NPDC002040]|uniref:hypothetical protein n=1 Tax=Kitasatospora sp. NPDC002040 TaxID=3154661 RepID=UPI0033279A75
MNPELAEARSLVDSGDPQGAMRVLRTVADGLPATELAPLVERLARTVGFDDLAEAAAQLASGPDGIGELYEYAYACIDRGASQLAVPALRQALALSLDAPPRRRLFSRRSSVPTPRQVLLELAVALEDGQQHAEAVTVLQQHDRLMADWPDRYLLVHNAVMDGRLDLARQVFDGLGEPDQDWREPADRIRRTLARAADAVPADTEDLRGWHYTLTGGLLTTLSPYGFRAGMTGRWAYLHDSFDSCRYGLERLRAVLAATDRKPASVALLPDRGSQALGLAAARLLGLPAAPYRAGTPDVLVVAYDLNACEPELVAQLLERADGEILFEHATCWTDTPAVSADICTLLAQVAVAPWESGVHVAEDGEPDQASGDRRSAEQLADAILAAGAEPDQGDGETPADPEQALTAFARRVDGSWLTGARDRIRSAGPVRSSSFR